MNLAAAVAPKVIHSTPDLTIWPTIIGVVVSVITIIALVVYGRKYISSQSIKAQLDAKDAVIQTNEQSIVSLEKRLTTLERDFVAVNRELVLARERAKELETTLEHQAQRYEDLRAFAAPEAIKALQDTLHSQHDRVLAAVDSVARLVERISQRLD